jgi:hypothetical protein
MSLEDEIAAIFRQCERDCGIRHITAEARIRALLAEGMAATGEATERARKIYWHQPRQDGSARHPNDAGHAEAVIAAIAAAITAAVDGERRAALETAATFLDRRADKFLPLLLEPFTGGRIVEELQCSATEVRALATEATTGEGGTASRGDA